MNPDIKRRWVEALRSGRYAQGHHVLRETGPDTDEDRFCCLGVLCELAVEDGVIPPPRLDPAYTISSGLWVYGDDASTYPPPRVLDWAGLPSLTIDHEPVLPFITTLAGLNDGKSSPPVPPQDFHAIADYIEQNAP